MTTIPSNSKHHQPLHNFSLPFLRWGHRIQSNNHHPRRRYRNSPPTDSDLNKPRRSPNNLKTAIKDENDAASPNVRNSNGNVDINLIDDDVATADNGDVKPWNLRPRRLVIDTVDGNGKGNCAVTAVTSAKSGRLLRTTAAAEAAEEEDNAAETVTVKKKTMRLWISLSKEDIEEDIYAFTGSRPSRRPKKRNKIVQKQLDNVFPGLYLVGVSADSYRV